MPAQVRTKYEGNNGTIYAIRMSPDYAAKAGTAPTGAVSSPIAAKISKGNKQFGIRPRGVGLARTVGTAPDTFTKNSFLPVLTKAEIDTPAFAPGATIVIGANTWTVVSQIPEDY